MTTTMPTGLDQPTTTDPLAFIRAYEGLKSEFLAIPQHEIIQVNLDIQNATQTVVGSVPKVLTFRAAIVKSLVDTDIKWVDTLGPAAHALMHCQREYIRQSESPAEVDAIAAELAELKDLLLTDVTALVKRKVLQFDMGDLRGGNSYKNLQMDTLLLTGSLRPSHEQISNRTSITLAEIDRAEELAHKLWEAIGKRDNTTKTPTAVAEERARAFTYFLRCISEVRRALTYLRWDHNDVDDILPSPYGNRGGGSKPRVEDGSQKSNPVSGPSSAGDQPASPPAPAAAPTGPSGLPGSNPFGG